jgi:hypothetical protein
MGKPSLNRSWRLGSSETRIEPSNAGRPWCRCRTCPCPSSSTRLLHRVIVTPTCTATRPPLGHQASDGPARALVELSMAAGTRPHSRHPEPANPSDRGCRPAPAGTACPASGPGRTPRHCRNRCQSPAPQAGLLRPAGTPRRSCAGNRGPCRSPQPKPRFPEARPPPLRDPLDASADHHLGRTSPQVRGGFVHLSPIATGTPDMLEPITTEPGSTDSAN